MASSGPDDGRMTANSSPPSRQATSLALIEAWIASASVRRARSPAPWPPRSLIRLSPSRSTTRRVSSSRDGGVELLLEEAAVVEPGQLVARGGLVQLLEEQCVADGDRDDVAERAAERHVGLVPHAIAGIDDLHEADRLAAGDEREHEQRRLALLGEDHPLRGVVVVVRDADLEGLLRVEHELCGRELREVVHAAARDRDLVRPLDVLGEHDEDASDAVVRGELGGGRAGELGGAPGELVQDLAQVEARRERPRELEQRAQTIGFGHRVLNRLRGEVA
jgi:hypothetical protein